MLPRSEDGRVTVDVGDANYQICAFDQRGQRVRPASGGVAAVKFEGMASARRRRRIALLAPLYAANESDVHDDTRDNEVGVKG